MSLYKEYDDLYLPRSFWRMNSITIRGQKLWSGKYILDFPCSSTNFCAMPAYSTTAYWMKESLLLYLHVLWVTLLLCMTFYCFWWVVYTIISSVSWNLKHEETQELRNVDINFVMKPLKEMQYWVSIQVSRQRKPGFFHSGIHASRPRIRAIYRVLSVRLCWRCGIGFDGSVQSRFLLSLPLLGMPTPSYSKVSHYRRIINFVSQTQLSISLNRLIVDMRCECHSKLKLCCLLAFQLGNCDTCHFVHMPSRVRL